MSTSVDDRLRQGVVTRSAEATQALAEEFAATFSPRENVILALHGDLGAGKTTFVQGLARAFGVQEAVTSPTFNVYTLHRGPKRLLLHLDAYRLDSAGQLDELMLEDFLTPPYCLAVEWPEKIAGYLPPSALHVYLSLGADGSHAIKLKAAS